MLGPGSPAGVERQAVVGELAGYQQVGVGAFQVNADLRFAVEDADKARHRHQFHLQARVALEQRVHAWGEEHDADAFGHPQANFAQRGDGLGDFFLRQQRDVFHGFCMLEQGLA